MLQHIQEAILIIAIFFKRLQNKRDANRGYESGCTSMGYSGARKIRVIQFLHFRLILHITNPLNLN